MRCYECGGALTPIVGSVKMTKEDGGLIIFKGIPLKACSQCGEQYISGEWSDRIGEMLRREETLVPQEVICVPVIAMDSVQEL